MLKTKPRKPETLLVTVMDWILYVFGDIYDTNETYPWTPLAWQTWLPWRTWKSLVRESVELALHRTHDTEFHQLNSQFTSTKSSGPIVSSQADAISSIPTFFPMPENLRNTKSIGIGHKGCVENTSQSATWASGLFCCKHVFKMLPVNASQYSVLALLKSGTHVTFLRQKLLNC